RGDQFVGRPRDIQVCVERAGGQRSAFRKVNAQCGEKRFQVAGGHVLAFDLGIDDGFVSGRRNVPERCAAALPILSVDGLSTPASLRRLYFVAKFTVTGTPAGEPPATNSALDSLALPLVCASPPCEDRLASRSTIPPRPMEGSRNPVEARFNPATFSLAFSGVSAVSA